MLHEKSCISFMIHTKQKLFLKIMDKKIKIYIIKNNSNKNNKTELIIFFPVRE